MRFRVCQQVLCRRPLYAISKRTRLEKVFEYNGKGMALVVDVAGFVPWTKKVSAKWMAKFGLEKKFAESPEITAEQLASNRERLIRITTRIGKTVAFGFSLLPFFFIYLLFNKRRICNGYTEKVEELINKGLEIAPSGRIYEVEKIQTQVQEYVALGGKYDQEKFDDMIQTVHTTKCNKLLKKAWRLAKKGEVGNCAQTLAEVYESKQKTDVGVPAAELDAIMLTAHETFLSKLVDMIKYSEDISEAWRLVEQVKSYSVRYNLAVDADGLDNLWKRKVQQLQSRQRAIHMNREANSRRNIPAQPGPQPQMM